MGGKSLKLAKAVSPKARAVDPFWVSRQSLDAEDGVLKPGCGWLPADWMPNEALRRAIRSLARSDDALLSYYGGTQGSLTLRRLSIDPAVSAGVILTTFTDCIGFATLLGLGTLFLT